MIAPESLDVDCKKRGCGNKGATRTPYIDLAPEYLRVHLNLAMISEEGEEQKNLNPIEIPEILDLTDRVYRAPRTKEPEPVRYKLISTLYHAGQTSAAGHWTAAVSCPPDNPSTLTTTYSFCNDATIRPLPLLPTPPHNPLTSNPLTQTGTHHNVVVMMYERLPTPPATRSFARELETDLQDAYYDTRGAVKMSAKRKKEYDDGVAGGLRRSKRVRGT